jgi:hypothetical protein
MADAPFDPRTLMRRDLRRLVSELWEDERCDAVAVPVLEAAIGTDAKSLDRAVIGAYLRYFPRAHPAFEPLRAASALGAGRRDWPWRTRGERWQLWDATAGPAGLAWALLGADDARATLREIGLDGDLAEGEFVTDALETACDQVGSASGEAAISAGERLIGLFERLGVTSLDAHLTWALLHPWRDRTPPDAYRERLTKLLVGRIGDPRFQRGRWDAIASEMPGFGASALVDMVRRWLVRSTVEQFFKIIARTTDNPAQWAQRTTFWVSYLRENLIDDAWFVLGPRAEELFRLYADTELPHGKIKAGDGGAGHSALVMAMGDLRIAEWSDNGACRFWPKSHADAPALGDKSYLRSKLKARSGDRGFEKLAHLPSPGWEPKFARKIYENTGIRHPHHGSGYARSR